MTARILAACAMVGLATSSLALTGLSLIVFYALNGVARPLIADMLHRCATDTDRAAILSMQSLTVQLSGVVAALTIGRLAQHLSPQCLAVGAGVLACGATACISIPEQVQPPSTGIPPRTGR